MVPHTKNLKDNELDFKKFSKTNPTFDSKNEDIGILKETFRVKNVVGKSYKIEIEPENKIQETGFITLLSLEVEPILNNTSPIKHLLYSGISPVKKDDFIIATIPKFQKEYIHIPSLEENIKPLIREKKISTNERAIAIQILTRTGKIIREDRSFDYNSYLLY